MRYASFILSLVYFVQMIGPVLLFCFLSLIFRNYKARCRDPSHDSGTVPFAFFISWQSENLYNDPPKAHKASSAQQTAEKDYLEMEGVKVLLYQIIHTKFSSFLLIIPGHLSNGYVL